MKTSEGKNSSESVHHASPSSDQVSDKKFFESTRGGRDSFFSFGPNQSGPGIIQKKGAQNSGNGNIPKEIRRKMEKAFQTDFSDVKVKENSRETEELDAIAYTQGNEINFAPDHNPYSSEGQKVLGHELAHVVQQRNGLVEATHEESGYQVNIDPKLEAKADQQGEKAANGEKVNSNPSRVHQLSAQKSKARVIQKQPQPLPSGAPIAELVIDSRRVMSEFNRLWSTRSNYYSSDWNFDTINSLNDHPDLPTLVRLACGGDYFRGSNYWSSGWIDDGDVDILWAGDADLKAEMTMYVDYGARTHSGPGKFGSSSSTEDERSTTESTTVSGDVTPSIGGHEGAPGIEATAGVEHTSEQSRTMSVRGGSTLEMEMPSSTYSADVIFELRLSLQPSIAGAETWSETRMTGPVGHAIIGRPNQ